MSIQEKKSSKGTPFAIVKFSDLKSEFELFLFSDLLVSNRENLKTSAKTKLMAGEPLTEEEADTIVL